MKIMHIFVNIRRGSCILFCFPYLRSLFLLLGVCTFLDSLWLMNFLLCDFCIINGIWILPGGLYFPYQGFGSNFQCNSEHLQNFTNIKCWYLIYLSHSSTPISFLSYVSIWWKYVKQLLKTCHSVIVDWVGSEGGIYTIFINNTPTKSYLKPTIKHAPIANFVVNMILFRTFSCVFWFMRSIWLFFYTIFVTWNNIKNYSH